ncbi:MAG: hypothetical protein E6Q97_36745 [Desulfurellales bacterium]|nr:MAG: hypothetical protein E6Q97_36745 [Desulfurellales bacterium]
MQHAFGSGLLYGIPLTDSSGAAISNPTPVRFGTLQEVSIDISFDVKQLYGQNQFPVAVGRGKGKLSGKAKFAQLNGALINSLFFGQTLNSGIIKAVNDTTGAVIPASPYQVTPTGAEAGTWALDLGVINSSGNPLTRVASAPATGQYSVSAGVYTFAAADTGQTVFINYRYTATSTSAKKMTITNQPLGYIPSFQVEFNANYNGKQFLISLPNAISNKLAFSTKLDDFMVPEFDFEGFADASGNVMTIASAE